MDLENKKRPKNAKNTNKRNGHVAPQKENTKFEADKSPAAKTALKAFRLTYARVKKEGTRA